MRKQNLGPWATPMFEGKVCGLSSFWKQRMGRLERLAASNDRPSAAGRLLLLAFAVAAGLVPTIFFQQTGHSDEHAGRQQSARAEEGYTADARETVARARTLPNRIEMSVGTQQTLAVPFKVPRLVVEKSDVVQVIPRAPKQLLLVALRPGGTGMTIWDESDETHRIELRVRADLTDLRKRLQTQFPDARIEISSRDGKLHVTGTVPRANQVGEIREVVQDHAPDARLDLRLVTQRLLLQFTMLEVSRDTLRAAGFKEREWTTQETGLRAALPNGKLSARFGVVSDPENLKRVFNRLRQEGGLRAAAEATLRTVSGRPARHVSGQQIEILVPGGLGETKLETKTLGQRVDLVPICLADGRIRLEVRPQSSFIDADRTVTINGVTVPGLRTAWVDVAVEMKPGEAFVLSGLEHAGRQAREDDITTLILVVPTLVPPESSRQPN